MTTFQFHPIIAEADFPEDGKFAAQAGGWNIVICRLETGFHAINDRCSHAASPLSTGRIRRGAIMCPLHGARFNIATGACIGGPYQPLRTFELRIVDGQIEVAVPDAPPGPNDVAIVPV